LTARTNNSVSSRLPGSSIVHNAGIPTTATGNNAVATTATAFLTSASADISVRTTGSASTASPSSLWADIPASNTTAIGSAWLTRGQGTGRMTGTTPTTFTSPMSITATICSTAGIPTSELRSASRCSGSTGCGFGRAAPLVNPWQGANHAWNYIDRDPSLSTPWSAAAMAP